MAFFTLKNIDGKWFLLTPDGEPFFMRGANHYGNGDYLPLNLRERYGDRAAWRRSVRDRHLEWGFNYLPPSIGPSEVDPEPIPPGHQPNGKTKPCGQGHRTPEWPPEHFVESGMPFTAFLGVPKQFMGNGPFPDVFSREFREAVDRRCREFCEPLKDNPNLIGYHFCQNPPWHPHADQFFEWVHQTVQEGTEAKKRWVRLMHQIYGDIERWRATYSMPFNSFEELHDFQWPLNGKISAVKLRRDKVAFMKRVCEEWYTVYGESIRKYDPNHLILGDRNSVHLQPLSDWAIQIMKRHVDVLSINVMGPMHTALQEAEQATENWDGPLLMADTGAGVFRESFPYPKSAYMCRDDDEFGEVYGGYVKLGVEHPQVIGLGWCGYYETCSSRSGLVDSVTDEPDSGKIAALKGWNAWVDEALAECFQAKSGR